MISARHIARGALLFALSVSAGVVANPEPIQTTAPSSKNARVFVSPTILRAMQGREKEAELGPRVIVNFETRGGRRGNLSPEDVRITREAILAALPAGSYRVIASFNRIAAVSLQINGRALEALRADARVYSINLDQEVHTTMIEANALTGADTVVASGITGDGVRVAVIDSGVDTDHPNLVDDMFLDQCFRTEGDCPGGATIAEDQVGHGTHVTGMITGANGVAPDVEFAALKVFTTGSTSDTNILNALDFVITFNGSAAPADKIDMVNMSLGGANFGDQASCDANSTAYVNAFATLNGQGTTVFVATGNDAQIDEVSSPGCVSGAVGVASTDDATYGTLNFSNCTAVGAPDKMTCFSNVTPVQGPGELVDLVAPGCLITSEWLAGGTDAICGTSMATPYTAGVAALVTEAATAQSMTFTPAQLEDHLESNAVQISDYRLPLGSPTFPRVNPVQAIGALDPTLTPTGFDVTGTTATTADMIWTASVSPAVTEYRIYRSVDGGAASLAGTVAAPTTAFTDPAAPCGELTYFVRGFNGSIESLDSNSDSATARDCPLPPTNLVLTPLDDDTVDLAWADNATDETGYVVEHQLAGGGFATLATLPAGTTTYQHDGLACGLNEYRVYAERAGDLSEVSNVVSYGSCAPSHDLRANARVVPPDVPLTDTELNATAKYGTESPDDPIYSCHFGGPAGGFNGVWYAITPTAPTRVTVTTNATTLQDPAAGVPDTLVGIYTHDGSSYTELACNDDISGSNFKSTVSSNLLNVGTTYYVFVSQWVPMTAAATGDLIVGFAFSAPQIPPPHDLVANARAINADPYTDSVANAQFATTSAGDPLHTAACAITARTGTHNMWYSFTPPTNGVLDLNTNGSSGSFSDTVMTVYTGTYGAFSEVACDDESGTGSQSLLNDVPVTAGTTYTIYVSRWSNTATTAAGTLVLNADFAANPGVIVTPTTVSATEGGATGSYTVVLATQPSSDVTVTISGDAQASADVPSLVFTNGTWGDAQTVTVTATNDAIIEGLHSGSITHAASSGDAGYNGLSVPSVTVNITDDDALAVADDDTATVDEDSLDNAIDVLANDTADPDDNALEVTAVSDPANGSASFTATGVTYSPDAQYCGADSFTYTVNGGDTANVAVDVTCIDDAPTANAQGVITDEDVAASITLTATAVGGDAVTGFAVATPPTNGTLTGTAPDLTYTPNAHFSGSDSFTFTATSGTATSTAATVSITVNPVDDAPTADAQSVTTDEDVAASITLTATAVGGDAVTGFAVATQPTNGTLTGTAPDLTYTPNADFSGSDSFTFTATSGTATSTEATVSITVDPVDDAPTADAQSVTTDEDVAASITLTATAVGGDAVTDFAVATQPTNGTLTGTAPDLTYTPNADFSGNDSFTFTATSGTATSTEATVSITVDPVDDAPTADAQSVTTDENVAASITLTATAVGGDAVTGFAVATQPANGTLSGTAPDLTYTPNADFSGNDSFTFTATSGTATSTEATVSITVNPVADDPDLAVSQQDDTTVVEPGDLHDYVITVTANGANGTVGANYTAEASSQLEGLEWTCEPAAECPSASGAGNSDLLVDLDGGESLTFTVSGTVAAAATGELVHTVAIEAPAGQTDSEPLNNQAVDTNQIDTFANGFYDGFEDLQGGPVTLKVAPSFRGEGVSLDVALIRELRHVVSMVPVKVLSWTLPEGRGDVAAHVRVFKGELQMRLATKVAGLWQIGTWNSVDLDEKALRVSVEVPSTSELPVEISLDNGADRTYGRLIGE